MALLLLSMDSNSENKNEDNQLKRTQLPEEKRHIFVHSIRQHHRQQLLHTMREQIYHVMPLDHRDPSYNSDQMVWLHNKWRDNAFDFSAAEEATAYMIETKGRVMQREAIRFTRDLSLHLNSRMLGEGQKRMIV